MSLKPIASGEIKTDYLEPQKPQSYTDFRPGDDFRISAKNPKSRQSPMYDCRLKNPNNQRLQALFAPCSQIIHARLKGLAGELGFEPRLAESESAVLPLDDSPIGQGPTAEKGRSRAALLPFAWGSLQASIELAAWLKHCRGARWVVRLGACSNLCPFLPPKSGLCSCFWVRCWIPPPACSPA